MAESKKRQHQIGKKARRKKAASPKPVPLPFEPRVMKRTTEYVTRLLREQGFESEEEMTVFLQGLQGKKVVAPARKALERAQDLMYAAFEAAHHESGRQDNVTAWTWWNRTSGRPCPTGCG